MSETNNGGYFVFVFDVPPHVGDVIEDKQNLSIGGFIVKSVFKRGDGKYMRVRLATRYANEPEVILKWV